MAERSTKPPLLRHTLREALAIPTALAAPIRRVAASAPFADETPALVIPGMMSGDISTSLLRRSLIAAGYDAHGWGIPMNTGIRRDFMEIAERRLSKIAADRPATIVGWSLGGIYARVLAQRHPDLVSQVVTLGSPFSGDRHANRAWRLYDTINDHTVDDPPFDDDPAVKPNAHTIAMWSPTDGVVSPECSRGDASESDEQIEFPFTHLEMGSSPRAVAQIIGVLADRHRKVST